MRQGVDLAESIRTEGLVAVFEAQHNAQVLTRWTEGAFAMRKGRIDYAYYAKRASGSTVANASPAALWRVISAIGNGIVALYRCRQQLNPPADYVCQAASATVP